MKLNLTNKQKAYGTLLVVIIISVISWYFSDSYSIWTSTASPWLAMLANIILNPAYIILILWLWSEYGWRGVISGFLISIAIDIVSLTHSVLKSGMLPTGITAVPLFGYSDTLIYKEIIKILSAGPVAVFITYVVIPVLLVYISLRIIRRNASFNRLFKELI